MRYEASAGAGYHWSLYSYRISLQRTADTSWILSSILEAGTGHPRSSSLVNDQLGVIRINGLIFGIPSPPPGTNSRSPKAIGSTLHIAFGNGITERTPTTSSGLRAIPCFSISRPLAFVLPKQPEHTTRYMKYPFLHQLSVACLFQSLAPLHNRWSSYPWDRPSQRNLTHARIFGSFYIVGEGHVCGK